MRRTRVDRTFIENTIKQFQSGRITSKIVQYNQHAKYIIAHLAQENILLAVVNLGAGVKKLIRVEFVCPHCKGKGYSNIKEELLKEE